MSKEKLYRVECICSKCGAMLVGSDIKPTLTLKTLKENWASMVISAPLNAPKCPKCGYSSDRDYNAGINFLIDDGKKKITSHEFFKEHKED